MNQQTSFNSKNYFSYDKNKKIFHNESNLENIIKKLKTKNKNISLKNRESTKKCVETLLTTATNQHQTTRPLTPLSPSIQSNADYFDNILDNTNISDYSDSFNKSITKKNNQSSSQILLTIKCSCNKSCSENNTLPSISSTTSSSFSGTKKTKRNNKNSNSYLRLNDCLSPSPSPTPSSSSITYGLNYSSINFLNSIKFKGN